jgi:hypothetical protein
VTDLGSGRWQLRFRGQELALGMRRPLRIAVDDGAPREVRPPVESREPVTVALGLPDGEHVVTLEGELPPETFLVARARPLALLWLLAPALLILALAAISALALARLYELGARPRPTRTRGRT